MSHSVDTTRAVTMDIPGPPGSLQGLIDELVAVRDRGPAFGPDIVVQSISGGGMKFRMTLVKPD